MYGHTENSGGHAETGFQVFVCSPILAICSSFSKIPSKFLNFGESELFDGLPYERYLFLLHLSNQGFGGLEHKDSCSLIYSRFGFRSSEKYHRFMQLVAHEFFHLWNVKRIRPKALEVFDYEQEN